MILKKKILHITVCFAICHLSFLECVRKFGEEKDWEKMPKGYDHLKNNKLCSLTSCPKDALTSQGSLFVGFEGNLHFHELSDMIAKDDDIMAMRL